MSGESEKGKSLAKLGLIIGLLSIIAALLVSTPINDFSVSLDTMEVNDVKQGGTAHTEALINFYWPYDENVSLRTEEVPGINIRFEPPLITPEGESASKITIAVDKDAPAGEHWIPVTGMGSDGKEHDCKLKLNIIPVTPTEGEIQISSSPAGASIYLDGTDKGKTPVTLDDIEQGQHNVTLKFAGYEDWSQTINVEAGKTIILQIPLIPITAEGTISIYSSPYNARVYIDGTYQGQTPMVLKNIEPGSHKIKLKLKGYEDWTETRNTEIGKTTEVLARLTPIQTETETETETPPAEVNFIYPSSLLSVNVTETLIGAAKNIPEGKHLWIAIYPEEAYKYYPQYPVDIQSDGSWMLPVQFGEGEHVGDKFDIYAVLADDNAQKELINYIETSEKTSWDGIRVLPDGTEKITKLTVIRA